MIGVKCSGRTTKKLRGRQSGGKFLVVNVAFVGGRKPGIYFLLEKRITVNRLFLILVVRGKIWRLANMVNRLIKAL